MTNFYFFDSSAIAKLYHTEFGSHISKEIFDNTDNTILFSELAYTETLSVLLKHKNRGTLTEVQLQHAIQSFENDFFINRASRIMPVPLSNVVPISKDIFLELYALKQTHLYLPNPRSLDTLQFGSWRRYKSLGCHFVTGDKGLAAFVSQYVNSNHLSNGVYDLNCCTCATCDTLRRTGP